MLAAKSIADELESLGRAELDDLTNFLAGQSDWMCGGLLIEACRAMDHVQVMQGFGRPAGEYLPAPDFDLLTRGWNVLLGLLLPRVGKFTGIPIAESTEESRHFVLSLMHAAGRYVMLTDAAERMRNGMVEGTATAEGFELAISEPTLVDFFHDQVDRARLVELQSKFRAEETSPDGPAGSALRAEMAEQVFPWELPCGVMIGYTSTRNIDAAFLNFIADSVLDWRGDAGIHPDAKLEGCTGADLVTTAHMLLGRYLQHVIYVEEARKRFPDVNHAMSLTIWKTRSELIAELVAIGTPRKLAAAVIEIVTVKSGDAAFFLKEHTPSFPMLIEIADGYLLMPISAIFRNPFKHIRMLREAASQAMLNSVRVHHERWMADDLCSLFQGNRYQRMPGQTKLRTKGRVITDIDAALFDYVTGELVLFQLKWQDFASSNLRTQRSKAKNFVESVENWGRQVTSWLEEHGVPELCRALKVKLPAGELPRTVRLWGVGRSNARFRSLGYEGGPSVLVLTWPQLIRLRYEIGPGADVFTQIAERVLLETSQPIARSPIPYVMTSRGSQIVFKDIWSSLDER